MKTKKTLQNTFEKFKVSLNLKLATRWASLMFLYIYIDYFALFMPGKMEDILKGYLFDPDSPREGSQRDAATNGIKHITTRR